MSCPPSIVPDFGCDSGDGGGGSVAGVSTLNTLSGALSIVPGNTSITVTPSGNQIAISANLPDGGVESVNGQGGTITITGSGATNVTNAGSAITVNTTLPSIVNTINTSATGAVTIAGSGASSVSTVGNAITVNTTLPSIVNTINTNATGAVSIVGDGITNVSTVGNVITIGTPADVTSVNGQIGQINIQGDPTGSATVQTFGANVNIYTPNIPVSNITGSGIAIVTNASGVFNVEVPAPPSATVTDIIGSGIADVTSSAGVFTISVPTPDVTSVVGSGVATVTSSLGIYTVNVPTPPSATVTDITGSGIATVTSNGTVFNIEVDAGAGGTSITQGGGTVSVDSLGSIILTTATLSNESITASAKGNISFTAEVGNVILATTTNENAVNILGSGAISLQSSVLPISLNTNLTLDTTGNILTFAEAGGLFVGEINGVLKINGEDYPPTATSGVVTLNGKDGAVNLYSSDGSVIITPSQPGQKDEIDLTVSFPPIPAYKLYRTVTVIPVTPVEGDWFAVAEVEIENDYNSATLFLSGNVEIRYDASFVTAPIPPAVNPTYGDYIIRVISVGNPGEYVPQIRRNCLYLPPNTTPPNLARDVMPFTYYDFSFPTTILGPVVFQVQVYLNNMDPTTTTFTGVDLSIMIIKAVT